MKYYLLFLAICMLACQKKEMRPNIIYIMVDDMGHSDLSCFGRKDHLTPVLDHFATEGVLLTQAYAAAAMCTPTRVGFMTGRYPARHPIGLREPLLMDSTDLHIGVDASTPTVPALLREHGYQTALVGKWHLGFEAPYLPLQNGFEYFYGITAGGADYISHTYEGQPTFYENDKPIQEEGYLTDLLTARAIRFLKEHDNSRPFFLSLQYTAPHWPWQLPGDKALPDSVGMKAGGSTAVYGAMVQNLDTNISKVLATLKEQGLEERTLVIFTSDNGGERYSDMSPFKGKKFQLWEGGIRVPAIVRWPGQIAAGTRSAQPVITMDWSATVLTAAGVPVEDLKLDGQDVMPQLKGATTIDRNFFWRVSNRTPYAAYRAGQWKYLREKEDEFLFNLDVDAGELKDVKDSLPDLFQKLKGRYDSLNGQMLTPYLFPVR